MGFQGEDAAEKGLDDGVVSREGEGGSIEPVGDLVLEDTQGRRGIAGTRVDLGTKQRYGRTQRGRKGRVLERQTVIYFCEDLEGTGNDVRAQRVHLHLKDLSEGGFELVEAHLSVTVPLTPRTYMPDNVA